DVVLDHPGDDPLEAVAGRLGDHLVVLGKVPMATHELGQGDPLDHPLAALGPPRSQPAGVPPAAHRVDADPEELGPLAHPISWHLLEILTSKTASARYTGLSGRNCG